MLDSRQVLRLSRIGLGAPVVLAHAKHPSNDLIEIEAFIEACARVAVPGANGIPPWT
jgi:hypothetical protein